MTAEQSEPDPEIAAISAVYAAVRGLEPDAQGRVLRYVASKLRISLELDETDRDPRGGASMTVPPDFSRLTPTLTMYNQVTRDSKGLAPQPRSG